MSLKLKFTNLLEYNLPAYSWLGEPVLMFEMPFGWGDRPEPMGSLAGAGTLDTFAPVDAVSTGDVAAGDEANRGRLVAGM
jgi:hypothetical protein